MAQIINKKTGRVIAKKNSEKQELWCHECESYVQFPIDLSMNGNHILNCPNCGHEHCRVVKDGRITSARWASRNRDSGSTSATFFISSYAISASTTTTITASTYATGWGGITVT